MSGTTPTQSPRSTTKSVYDTPQSTSRDSSIITGGGMFSRSWDNFGSLLDPLSMQTTKLLGSPSRDTEQGEFSVPKKVESLLRTGDISEIFALFSQALDLQAKHLTATDLNQAKKADPTLTQKTMDNMSESIGNREILRKELYNLKQNPTKEGIRKFAKAINASSMAIENAKDICDLARQTPGSGDIIQQTTGLIQSNSATRPHLDELRNKQPVAAVTGRGNVQKVERMPGITAQAATKQQTPPPQPPAAPEPSAPRRLLNRILNIFKPDPKKTATVVPEAPVTPPVTPRTVQVQPKKPTIPNVPHGTVLGKFTAKATGQEFTGPAHGQEEGR